MRTISIFLAITLAFLTLSTTKADSKNELVVKPAKIIVYYFHYERRCATCVAVEEETVKALNELYAAKMKSGEIVFQSVNLEEKEGEALADRLKVAGQTLLVVAGDKHTDLTEQGFLYAKSNPAKLKAELQKSISLGLK